MTDDLELSPEVEEKETFGCWVCDERMSFKKLITHLRAHSQTEKMLAYTTQTTAERKERKSGKTGQSGTHLQQEATPVLGEVGPGREAEAEVRDSSEREDPGVPVLPGRGKAPDVQVPKLRAGTAAAEIANL